MIGHFPAFIKKEIERDVPIQFEGEDHPSVLANQELESRHQLILTRIRSNCLYIKSVSPDHWKSLEVDLGMMYHEANQELRRPPSFFMNRYPDSNYYALAMAHVHGQVEILEAIFGATGMEPKPVEKKPKINFFKKLVDTFLKKSKLHSRS